MPDPNCVPFLEVPLAYAGPGAGLELVPYFLALLAWAGLALGAVCLHAPSRSCLLSSGCCYAPHQGLPDGFHALLVAGRNGEAAPPSPTRAVAPGQGDDHPRKSRRP